MTHFPFIEMNLERKLEQAMEDQRRAFLSDLAEEPQRADSGEKGQKKGQEIPSYPTD